MREVTLGLTRLAADEVMIAGVIQDGEGRTLGESLLIVALRFVALLLGIELAGAP